MSHACSSPLYPEAKERQSSMAGFWQGIVLPATLALAISAQAHTPFRLASADFASGRPIPAIHEANAFGCHGQGIPLTLSWGGAPRSTRSFALTMIDTDAPGGSFVHWIVYGIPASRRSISPGSLSSLRQGRNSAGLTGYFGPCPPPGSGPHHYHVSLYALDVSLRTGSVLELAALQRMIKHHVLAKATLIGTFRRA
jgi:Raf kinase inhibitor-like YbhB/YbcL family protein